MKQYEARTFTIPELKGLSSASIEEHLTLYKGYVKHTNLILEEIAERDAEKDAYAIAEMQRRFAFEFDGMRNHEYYFAGFEGGPQDPQSDSDLYKAIEAEWESFDAWFTRFKTIAKTRGVGWAILYYDPEADRLLNAWIDEQHLGHLSSCQPILALDMWEHSFVADYQPSGKGQYIEDFFENLNWSVIEANYQNAQK